MTTEIPPSDSTEMFKFDALYVPQTERIVGWLAYQDFYREYGLPPDGERA